MQHLIEVSEKFSNISFDANDYATMNANPGFATPNFHRLYLLMDRKKVTLDKEF